MKINPFYAFVLAVILAASAVLFIWKSNDHLECTETITYTTDAAGSQLTTKQHNCQEKYSF
ncbi:hypothetical protein WG947_12355 [Pontibacter sp. H259]|uniref:hypothetical protein n=1 Tax=Pontibacter sp. H259 TaxID=3133421 RepID=UPI0030BCAA46